MAGMLLGRHRTSGLAVASSRLGREGIHGGGEVRVILLTVAIILAFALLYVWQHIQVIRMGYRVEQLNSELSDLMQEEKELTLRIAQLKSLARIEGIARRRFGMAEPSPSQILVITGDKRPRRTFR